MRHGLPGRRGSRQAAGGGVVRLGDPGHQEGVADRQEGRTDEEAEDAEGDQAAQHPGEDEEQGQIGSALDQDRAEDVVDEEDGDRPRQEERPPGGAGRPVHPDHGGEQDGSDPHLRHPQDEHEGGQDDGEGNAGDRQADAPQSRLDEGGDDDPQRDCPDGLRGQERDPLAGGAGEAPGEAADRPGRPLAAGVEDGGDDHGEEELDDEHPDAARLRHAPAHDVARVRGQTRRQSLRAGHGQGLPLLGEPLAGQREPREPGGRRGQTGGGHGFGQADQPVGVLDDGQDGKGQRKQQHQEQGQRHRGDSEGARASQPGLDREQERPGRHHDGARPDHGEEERPQDPEAAGEQGADETDLEQAADQIAGRLGHGMNPVRARRSPRLRLEDGGKPSRPPDPPQPT